jgi:transcriptional regulator with XRE-family HTH domain
MIAGMPRANRIAEITAQPGALLRRARLGLGLTYRDVKRASSGLARARGRSEFVIHPSRLAEYENSRVTPGIHKLYTLAVVYHLDPFELCRWYGVPLDEHFQDGLERHGAPRTHVAAAPHTLHVPLQQDSHFDPRHSACLPAIWEEWKQFEGVLFQRTERYRYGYVGLEDHWMEPLVRPGSLVLIDPARKRIQRGSWRNEYARPIYFVDLRESYRCCWCVIEKGRLILQPHTLSGSAPEAHRYPDEAEVIGQVVGVAMRLTRHSRTPA